MNLKTNVTRRAFAFSVTAETKAGELRMFDHTVDGGPPHRCGITRCTA